MNKNFLSILFISFLILGCGNPELDKRVNLLNLAIADKNHYEIILNAESVLQMDPENITAISAIRDSARVYSHIRMAAESLKMIDEKGFDDSYLEWTMDTKNDDPEFIEYLMEFSNTIGSGGDNTESRIKGLNQYVGGFDETDAPNEVTDILKARMVLYDIALAYGEVINDFKEQVNYLTEAKNHLKKAERLDPRFRGVIDLEDYIEERAKIFTMYAHLYFTAEFAEIATEAAGYFDDVYAATNKSYDDFALLRQYGGSFGMADAYQSGKFKIDSKDYSKHKRFEIYQNNSQALLSLYKDLEDDFDRIDSLDPAIEMVTNMIAIFKNTEASGSLNDWNNAMSDSVAEYIKAYNELNNELDDLGDLTQSKEEVNSELDIILNEEIIQIVDQSEFI